jgi:hypothetical protein
MSTVRPKSPKANSYDVQAVIACVLLLASVAFATLRASALGAAPTAPVDLLAVGDGGPPEPPPDEPDSRPSPTLPLPPPSPAMTLAAR